MPLPVHLKKAIRLAVMDIMNAVIFRLRTYFMWKAFRNAMVKQVPKASILMKKSLLPTVAALCDVVGKTGSDYPCHSRHAWRICFSLRRVNN